MTAHKCHQEDAISKIEDDIEDKDNIQGKISRHLCRLEGRFSWMLWVLGGGLTIFIVLMTLSFKNSSTALEAVREQGKVESVLANEVKHLGEDIGEIKLLIKEAIKREHPASGQ